MDYQCTAERFAKDVTGHAMKVKMENGLYRHLRFDEDGSSVYHFEIVTWPGYLCICGDMGSYTFWRTPDMFAFFRSDRGINASYWSEKVVSNGRKGIQEFSKAAFKEAVKYHFDSCFDEPEPDQTYIKRRDEIWQQVEQEILSNEDEHQSFQAVYDFECDGFQFEDFSYGSAHVYTFNFIWCLYAIVHAIKTYDASKAPSAIPEPTQERGASPQ